MQQAARRRPPRLCFVSYGALSDLARTVIQEFADRAEIEIVDATFGAAVAAARAREAAGTVDVFLSAGSNAANLREAVKLPVAEIVLDGFDVLEALRRARELADRVGVLTYGAAIAELDQVRPLFDLDVSQRVFRDRAEANAAFAAFMTEGRRVVVGSSLVVETARAYGLTGVLIYSVASIRKAVGIAIELARVARLDADRHEQVNAVLHNLQEAVIAVDADNRVVSVNAAMQALLGVDAASLQGRRLDAVQASLSLAETLRTGQAQRGQLLQFAGRDWIAHRTPLGDGGGNGAMLALYDASAIEEAGTSLRSLRPRRRAATARYGFDDLVGTSPSLRRAIESARRFAGTDLTVLITGETGTGKELFAQAIHRASRRADRPFVAINCSALPESLLESELFGYDDGAFTGSRRGGKPGLFEAAHTGTLFLDEIGDMPPALQTRLLRVLQEREVMRVGGTAAIPVDVRIIAATHQDLSALLARRRFRVDLYYRLNALRLQLPPLRERGDDVERLALGLLERALARVGSRLPAAAVLARLDGALHRHDWPGNVRELENLCERLAVLHAGYDTVDAIDVEALALDCPELFPPTVGPDRADRATTTGATTTGASTAAAGRVPAHAMAGMAAAPSFAVGPIPGSPTAATVADDVILAALRQCNGSRARTAERLGISRATLWRRLVRLQRAGLATSQQP